MRVRGSAIGISFPEFAALLSRWRDTLTSLAHGDVPPHITLLAPWRPAPVTPADRAAVENAIAGIQPFHLTFRGIDRFVSTGVLYLRPEPDEPVRRLTRQLMDAFPDMPPYGGAFGQPIPHLTVAIAGSDEVLDRLHCDVLHGLEPRLPLEGVVREITIAEQQADGSWISAYAIPLV